MEGHAEKPLLVLLVLSCLLVLPLVSSVPMPRSLRLGSRQQQPLALKLTSFQEMAIAAAINLDKPTTRMDFEINDYPSPDHNHHHGPAAQPGSRAMLSNMP